MKVKKTILGIVLAVVLLLVVAGVVVYFYLDHIVERTVETQATSSLKLKTELSGASLSLFGGTLGLDEIQIASPEGYAAPHMLTLGKADVAVSYGQLDENPVHVKSITLTRPMLVIEQKGGTLNFKRASELMSGAPASPPAAGGGSPSPSAPQPSPQPSPTAPPAPAPAPATPPKEQLRVIVDELVVKDARIVVRHGLPIPGIPPEINLEIPTFSMRNVGTGDGAQNGAALKDVAMQVITALAAQASSSGKLPAEFDAILKGDLSAVMTQLGAEAQKRVMAAVPGEAGKVLGSILADPSALTKDPGKAIGGAVQGLVPPGATTNPAGAIQGLIPGATTKPAGGLPGLDPGKAAEGLGGLLGGGDKKDKEKKGK